MADVMIKSKESSVQEIRKASQAVYLACEESVAEDISRILNWAADRIENLECQVTDLGWEVNPDRMGMKDLVNKYKENYGTFYRNYSGE